MFDSHCHLNFKAFVDDAPAVANAMAANHVSGLVVGCDPGSSRYAIDLAQTFPNLWASVGTHPTHVLDYPWDPLLMKELALEERVVAIGEVGLDFYRFPDALDRDYYIQTQYATFRSAIELAQQLNKPLIIHSRNAYDAIIDVLTTEFGLAPFSDQPSRQRNPRGTIHCFMGNPDQAQTLLDLDFMIGFTGVITYNDVDPALLEVIKIVPLEYLLIETDAPYLTPEPYRTRGKKQDKKIPRNRPEYVTEVATTIAGLRNLAASEIIELTEANARRLFKINT